MRYRSRVAAALCIPALLLVLGGRPVYAASPDKAAEVANYLQSRCGDPQTWHDPEYGHRISFRKGPEGSEVVVSMSECIHKPFGGGYVDGFGEGVSELRIVDEGPDGRIDRAEVEFKGGGEINMFGGAQDGTTIKINSIRMLMELDLSDPEVLGWYQGVFDGSLQRVPVGAECAPKPKVAEGAK